MLDPPSSVGYNALSFNSTELEHNAPHLAVARKAALEGMTLFKNEKNSLPLDPKKLTAGSVAVVGLQGNISGYYFGNYAAVAETGNWGVSIVDALAQRLQPNCSVTFAPGLDDLGSNTSSDGFAAGKRLAAEAEAVIVVLGLAFNHFCHGGGTNEIGPCTGPCRSNSHCEGEAKDRTAVELPEGQAKMVAALRRAVGSDTPLVGVMVHGGAIALGETLGQLDALLDAWQPGLEGGPAIAATLVGDASPAGRTAVTWYSSSAEIPRFGYMGEQAVGTLFLHSRVM